MAEILIYSSDHLHYGRDEIEDDILKLLNDKGEMTGGGSGVNGWNIDIDVYNITELSKCCASIIDDLNTTHIQYKITVHYGM